MQSKPRRVLPRRYRRVYSSNPLVELLYRDEYNYPDGRYYGVKRIFPIPA
jgi:hypothetical protein